MSTKNINERMGTVCPELSSKFAQYPMKLPMWLDPAGKVPGSQESAFIGADTKGADKPNYVWGPGPLGRGYYHMLCRPAYNILYARVTNEAPTSCCCFPNSAADDYYDVKQLMYNRSLSPVPDDKVAKATALAIARGEAQAVYQFTQNEQLFLHAFNTGVNFNAA